MQFSDFFSRLVTFLLIPIFVCSPLSSYYDDSYRYVASYPDPFDDTKFITFDEVLEYLNQIEDGSLEYRCNSNDVDHIYQWVVTLARLGVVPGDVEAEAALNESILDLIEDSDRDWDYAFKHNMNAQFMLIPKHTAGYIEGYLCGGWVNKKLKQIARFVKEHKKEILIGTAVVVGAAAVVGIAYAVATAVGSTAAMIDHGSSSENEPDVISKAEEIRNDIVLQDVVGLEDPRFPFEENARIIGEMGAVQAFSKLESSVHGSSSFTKKLDSMGGLSPDNYQIIDDIFSSSKSKKYSKDFKENVYSARGEYALDIGLYSQAYSDLNKTLDINSKNDRAYLNRALVNIERGDVNKAIKDFKSHSKYRPITATDALRFSEGIMLGIPDGMSSSVESGLDFIVQATCHPITTGR